MSDPTSTEEQPAADDASAAAADDMRQHTEVEAEGPEDEEGADVPRVHSQDPAEG